ncbi:alpha/beta fold hydrolase [Photobacterium angustum]|uniref:Alpha/beta hydrolase n=1 Tax=Photobacterium angustum TaxID=661 RepID=A0A2S7VZB5_PHOAN|nr:alpha/beta hydrolase [Photobacterium angustum]PQJ67411.1 alpha/beta hydrolase [Photobacterium angustum]
MEAITFKLAELELAGLSNFSLSSPLDNDKPVLLFIHGWQDNAATFSSLWQRLEADFNLVAIDLPGHGLSQARSGDNYYHFFDYLDDLHQVITQLPATRVCLVGHSLGAIIASCYSAAYPQLIDKLVLIEGLSPLVEEAEQTVERLKRGIKSRQQYRKSCERRKARTMSSFTEALQLRANVNDLPMACLEPVVKRATVQRDGLWYWRHDHRLRCESLYRMTQQQAQAIMSSIEAPIYSIVGSHGFPQLRDDPQGKFKFQQFSQVVVVGGHHCHLEQPDTVSNCIRAFLSLERD